MPAIDSSRAASHPPDAPRPTTPPSLGALFAGFFSVGIIGFGGVLPLTRRMIVERRHWLTGPEFTDLLALCQFLPGGNVINVAAALGAKFRGLPGALAALAGLLAAPTAVAIALSAIYGRFQHEPLVRALFAGLAAAAAGLVIAMSLKIAAPLRRDPAAAILAVVCFGAVAVLRLPLLPTMLAAAPVGMLLAARFRA